MIFRQKPDLKHVFIDNWWEMRNFGDFSLFSCEILHNLHFNPEKKDTLD